MRRSPGQAEHAAVAVVGEGMPGVGSRVLSGTEISGRFRPAGLLMVTVQVFFVGLLVWCIRQIVAY